MPFQVTLFGVLVGTSRQPSWVLLVTLRIFRSLSSSSVRWVVRACSHQSRVSLRSSLDSVRLCDFATSTSHCVSRWAIFSAGESHAVFCCVSVAILQTNQTGWSKERSRLAVQPIGIIFFIRNLGGNGAPGRPLVPAEGPKLPPVSNDINSLAAAHSCCLGPFWWPLWWPQTLAS